MATYKLSDLPDLSHVSWEDVQKWCLFNIEQAIEQAKQQWEEDAHYQYLADAAFQDYLRGE